MASKLSLSQPQRDQRPFAAEGIADWLAERPASDHAYDKAQRAMPDIFMSGASVFCR
jgi:hypothetical protein